VLYTVLPTVIFNKREMFKRKKTQIEYDNKNSMWNDGHILVYVKGELKEHIFVDDFMEVNTDDDIWGAEDIIDKMKEKYAIDKVIRKEHNWR